ncbi:MAG: fibronectin type III domain-containing protein [Gemmatimonadota bacterium]
MPEAPDDAGSGAPTGPRAVHAVGIAWDPPTADADGRTLDDLAGYRVYFAPDGELDGPASRVVESAAPEAIVGDLTAGTWTFVVTAVDSAGNESARSAALPVPVGGS